MDISRKVYVSDIWDLGNKGHESLEFVDVVLNDDNLLFIDPCLIENWNNEWTKKAISTMKSFFDEFYTAYRSNDAILKHKLLSHASEQNATRLGYGRGDNGKGNTPEGLMHIFRPLEALIHQINTIGIPQDLTILIPGFAEDGFSDLLTNIIHRELNEFTITQMNKYGVKPNSTTTFYTWDVELLDWVEVNSPCYLYEKYEILLVPKGIVRKNYLFGVEQYFGRIILERKRAEDGWRDEKGNLIPKRVLEKQLRTDDENWKYKYVIDYSKEHNEALDEYHKKLPSFYAEYGQPLEDYVLDEIIYYK